MILGLFWMFLARLAYLTGGKGAGWSAGWSALCEASQPGGGERE